MNRVLLALTALLGSTACTSFNKGFRTNPQQFILHEALGEQGEQITYALVAGSDGVPSITLRERRTFDVARLGLGARSINGELARSLSLHADSSPEDPGSGSSVTPWGGLLVTRVEGGSPAALAGIATGDILLTLAGTSLSTSEQLQELIQEHMKPGDVVSLTLLERGIEGSYGTQPTAIEATLGAKEVEVTKSDTIALGSDLGVYHLTGLQVCTLTPELTLAIYGDEDPVTLVADALVGSPAYLAGLRSGDRVLTCDGQAVRSHVDISRAVLARSSRRDVPAGWFGPPAREGAVAAEGPISLEVDGPLGAHRASLTVVDDIANSFSTHIPIVYDYDSDVDSTSWSFLDFIFQFGANYKSHYRPSSSRSPQSSWALSILPFGMFEFESTPRADRCTFFWFIDIENRH